MADSLAQNYRTREDEEQKNQQPKVRFSDISITAAWIAATYHVFSPEEIRKNIHQQWANKVTQNLTRDPKFKDLFSARRRHESRQEYTARRHQQIEAQNLIKDLVLAHGDNLFEKSPQTQEAINNTVTDLIQNDYQGLNNKQADLLTAITQSQEQVAPVFKKQADKNNQRFEGKGFYRRTPDQLQAIKQQEQANFKNIILARRKPKAPPTSSRLNLPKPDLVQLNSLLKPLTSQLNTWLGSTLSKAGNLLGKLPGLGSLFGGGATAGGAAGAVGGAAGAGAAGAAGATGAAAAGAGAAGAAGATAAAATVEIWGPILLVVVIVVLLLLLIVLLIFNNPVAKPQALTNVTGSTPEISLTITPPPSYKSAGASLEEIMQLTSEKTCTPLAMLKAISRREAPTIWNFSDADFEFYNSYSWWNSAQINDYNSNDQAKICRGYGYDTCSNLIPADSKFGGQYCKSGPVSGICAVGANVMGPMQFEQKTWNGYKSQIETLLQEMAISGSADRRVILDAFLAAGLKLHQNSQATDCQDWNAGQIENAARNYYGSCLYTIGAGGNYCQEICDYYNQYSNTTVDCSLVGIN